jgi:NAD(P)-dependent dehydrogenase (short-subunit alcohol dehydrogenase family)
MSQTVVIAGVGPGLGASLARKFAREKCRVGMLARSMEYLKRLEAEITARQGTAVAVRADLTDPEQVSNGFRRLRDHFGPIDVLIYHAGNAVWKGLMDLTPRQFEEAWRIGPYGGFLCSQAVVPDMLQRGGGAILFTGATSSVRGRGGAPAFSSAKFGLRGLAESLARELWPQAIHVAHIVIDGVIDTGEARGPYWVGSGEPLLSPDAIADSYWNLTQQDRSAWTLELDLRPFKEEFFV